VPSCFFPALVQYVKGVHPAFTNLHSQYAIPDRRLFGKLERTLSALAHWCKLVADVPYIPSLVFPFVRLFEHDDVVAFEAVLCILLNWCSKWFEVTRRIRMSCGLLTSPFVCLCLSNYSLIALHCIVFSCRSSIRTRQLQCCKQWTICCCTTTQACTSKPNTSAAVFTCPVPLPLPDVSACLHGVGVGVGVGARRHFLRVAAIPVQNYAWPFLQTLFTEVGFLFPFFAGCALARTSLTYLFSQVLTRAEWLHLFDHVVSNEPAFLFYFMVHLQPSPLGSDLSSSSTVS
jgi:hypothetical protein